MASTPIPFDPFTGSPRIHGARRVGIRPGTELIHPLAATGERPLTFEVTGLPEGIEVDDEGILRGTAPGAAGEHQLSVRVRNAAGQANAEVTLCVGDALALTPPMGWNSWNVYGKEVTADVVVAMAEEMVSSGMRDLGYQYVNIDDHWHAEARGKGGVPLANRDTFPGGIAPVAERIHALGLKLGIYSDAGTMTCGHCFGGLGFEAIDAQAYAEWGVDLLKYDYCHAPAARDVAEERYTTMGQALAATDRSIVFSVCEWGLRKPWRWAADTGGSLWRTTPDIFDTFTWLPGGVRGIAWHNLRLAEFAGPGRWNDPDMLLVGNRGVGNSTSKMVTPKNKRMVWRYRGINDAQVQTHVSLWAMMAAPLLASHDLRASSTTDWSLLLNPEVLAIDQDPLGRQGTRVRSPLGLWYITKPLASGGVAVALCNLTRFPRRASLPLSAAGVRGAHQVTDAWSRADLGSQTEVAADLGSWETAVFVCQPVSGA